MKHITLRNLLMMVVYGSVVFLTGSAVNAQARDEYRDWQRAQAEAQREYREYLRTRSRNDYRDWQRAQREAQRERREYVRERRDDRRDAGRYYRVYRDGRYYRYDNQGVNRLRQAVNLGYQQGYREGQQDRRYGRWMNFNDSSVYRRASFGYAGYVARNQYQYYFQQGFQRGYEDGYYNTSRYGYRSGNTFNVIGSLLNTILNVVDDDN
jgi:flagellar biosynthesis/type III secretory pathway protein FliH